jgi:tetratricopeptide (TPR) repeat protein
MSEIEEEVTVEKTSKKINLRDYLGEDSSEFYQKNKLVINIISGVIGLALLVWGSYTGWDYFYVQPKHKESISFLWQAERDLFDSEEENKTQSILTALNGDSMMTYPGFEKVIKEYEGYKGGKLAQYYKGIAYLNVHNYDSAIAALSKVDFQDEIIGTMAIGAIGDAYMELGNVTKAYSYYYKAYSKKDNDLTTPMYMMKAAKAKELEKDYEKAKDIYQKIVFNYPSYRDSHIAEKYLESLNLASPVYQEEVK